MNVARGSQRQVQLWVNAHGSELEQHVFQAIPSLAAQADRLVWRSPLERDEYREYHDAGFLGAIGREDLRPALAAFWPQRGPVWDGLANVQLPNGGAGVLLVEGKSYPRELRSVGCRAGSEANRARITAAMRATQEWLGVTPVDPERWMGPLYQTANRLAHLYWLREVCGMQAWLCHLLFTDDVSTVATSQAEWHQALNAVDAELGLTGGVPDSAGHVILPAL